MDSAIYPAPDINGLPAELIDLLTMAHGDLTRFDERLKRSPELFKGWISRSLISEAAASVIAGGGYIDATSLTLAVYSANERQSSIADAHAVHTYGAWAKAYEVMPGTLLRSNRPGLLPVDEAQPNPATPIEYAPTEPIPESIDRDKIAQWQSLLRETQNMPALMAAAVAWDAWLTLAPEPYGDWKAPLLAALVLKSRNVTTNYLVPIDYGRQHSNYRPNPLRPEPFGKRLAGFLSWIRAAAHRAHADLDKLHLVRSGLMTRIASRKSNSRLPRLVQFFIDHAAVDMRSAARELALTRQGFDKILPRLGSYPVLLTERSRYRLWRIG
ncbi:MAG: DUF1612 domain-containing protein [Candidatus Competibacter sp.]|nr:DUF1612 domain-containing protein [Candidatus Competibacter sp.]